MSIVLQSTGGGSVTINEPTTASNFTQTLPASAGVVMVSGNMPAFSAYLSPSNQFISSGTWTKVTLNNEEFDTASAFDTATNYRFTPQVAGYYQINASVQFGASGNTLSLAQIAIYKNGSQYKVGGLYYSTSSNQSQVDLQVCSIVYLNGSTDYVELYGYNTATSPSFLQGLSATWFNGAMVRAA